MALSFGRKKGEATNEADNATANGNLGAESTIPANPTATGGTTEAIDESWFDTLAQEAEANPHPSTLAPPQSDFSVFSADEAEDFGDFGTQVDIPVQSAASNSGAFIDPALSDASTPFDMPPGAASQSAVPTKTGGGLKKVLPALLVLIIVGGGGAFWYSQQQTGNEGAALSAPPNSAPPTAPAPPSATGAPSSVAPTGALPSLSGAAADADTKIKAELKKLWNEGLALRKQNKNVAAKAKWGAAVRLARSKPGNTKSADLIQQAIDKIK